MDLCRAGHRFGWGVVLVLAGCAGNAPELGMWLKNNQIVEQSDVAGYPVAVVRQDLRPVRRFYIEGDGKAWVRRDLPSRNPTPENPVGLTLALADASGGVVYLGRPCQWVWSETCDWKVGTLGRFRPEVVEGYVELVKRLSGGHDVEVVGYSGGAFMALQIAARLGNVVRVVSVAGNVDPAEVNRLHKVTPVEVAPWPEGGGRLKEVDKVFYVGTKDTVVPEAVVRGFVARWGGEVVLVPVDHAWGGEGLRI